MNKLWNYGDYTNLLSHPNSIVRRWAFAAIENHYPNRYTDQASNLIGDEDEHLACASPRYLAKYGAIQHAPAILKSFETGRGNVPGNCATALGNMHYEPALDVMLENFTSAKSAETFLGILNYLGKIKNEDCRIALKSVVAQVGDTFIQGSAITNLWRHLYPDDVPFIMDRCFDSGDRNHHHHSYLRDITFALGGAEYFRNLTEFTQNSILEKPGKVINDFLSNNSNIDLDDTLRKDMIKTLGSGQYEAFTTMIMFEARRVVTKRYQADMQPDYLEKPFSQDSMGLALLEDISRRSSIWKQIKESKKIGIDLTAVILSGYIAIKERDAYLPALSDDAGIADLIQALKNAGPSFPKQIQKKIKHMEPISELNDILTNNLTTWGDIWTVRMMGRIGNEKFIHSLLRVLRDSDSMDYIYDDAIRAMNAMDESADDIILAAIKNGETGDWESFSVLKYLPYAEAYDLALQKWQDENNDMDSYEMFSSCLRGIADPRGIKQLQYIYNHENDAIYIGNDLECLSIIHNVDIPELPNIHRKRKEQKERQAAREKELNEIASNFKKAEKQKSPEKNAKVVTYVRDTPKVGRNEPCPCGSGKKYKKCCLNKSS